MFDEDAPGNSETHVVGMDVEGQGDEALMWVVDAFPNQKLKELSFLCGWSYWNNIDNDLTEVGYNLIENGNAVCCTIAYPSVERIALQKYEKFMEHANARHL